MTSSTVSSRNDRSRSSASAAATISASATSGVRRRRRPPVSSSPTLTLGLAYSAIQSHAPAAVAQWQSSGLLIRCALVRTQPAALDVLRDLVLHRARAGHGYVRRD